MTLPRITFGIIVLNGEPFTRYNLRALCPFAHQIIVVEGASEKAAAGATPDGHSIDGTLEILHQFKAAEDPDNKLTIVTAEDRGHPNGFWPGEKDQQSRAYAERATGDYLWQIDVDEFYKPEDIEAILNILSADPTITLMNVRWLYFWGGFGYLVDGLFLRRHYRDMGDGVPRIFKWGPGCQYATHRPPTVVDKNGIDLRKLHWIHGNELASRGIYCYHYSTCFPDTLEWKMKYYGQHGWRGHDRLDEWLQGSFQRIEQPFRVFHVTEQLSWLRRFSGTHPPQIEALIRDLAENKLSVRKRPTKDIEQLLSSKRYRMGAFLLSNLAPVLVKMRRYPRLEKVFERSLEVIFSPQIQGIE